MLCEVSFLPFINVSQRPFVVASMSIAFLSFIFYLSILVLVGNHYLRNRNERKTVREDVKAAKVTYLEEVKNTHILSDGEVQSM